MILLHDPWSRECSCAGRSFPEERSLGFGYLCMWFAFSYGSFLVVFANGTAWCHGQSHPGSVLSLTLESPVTLDTVFNF